MTLSGADLDPRAKISPSRRWAFRTIALIFIMSAVGSIPLWRVLAAPTDQDAQALRNFSVQVQSHCEFVGLNLWRSVVAGFPPVETQILCGISGVDYRDPAEKADLQGLTRAIIRKWGDHLRSSFDGMNLEVAIVPIGEKTSAFACFRPLLDPAWVQCDGNPEFGCRHSKSCVNVPLQ
jgi:hypothetical protein